MDSAGGTLVRIIGWTLSLSQTVIITREAGTTEQDHHDTDAETELERA
jgi:hypothetical protein